MCIKREAKPPQGNFNYSKIIAGGVPGVKRRGYKFAVIVLRIGELQKIENNNFDMKFFNSNFS
ncbi:MAG: hypothetical protein A2010_17885 [Nitrospirae bacterium GWD2_57_9]|nr:MAG: hypothetical protein A2010_17885 [Nitrospirae bacterium GWD2_57_9]OGW50475.1 MAG: hypothetical protein A2078_15945 [Nitrospirae bacterium GWC2_57_9]